MDVYRNGNILRMIDTTETAFLERKYGSLEAVKVPFSPEYQTSINPEWLKKQWVRDGFVLHEQRSLSSSEIDLPNHSIHFTAKNLDTDRFIKAITKLPESFNNAYVSTLFDGEHIVISCDGFTLGTSRRLEMNRLYLEQLSGSWNPTEHSVRSLLLLTYLSSHFQGLFKFVNSEERFTNLMMYNQRISGYKLSSDDLDFARALSVDDWSKTIRNSIIVSL